ncbi:Protein CBG15826 [Caenorhabditis briggsae]|uniref:Glycosyltransferase family 92 protein n=1 Tax=Caenorhabditis briggsae TaxID=6238 RepID=A8XMY0_CAEBR|nr:Protein CBG15826 [Caenorhabditis briggsae]CAP34005.1 Protein CBG15826 [Caenorhabditis briggsae]
MALDLSRELSYWPLKLAAPRECEEGRGRRRGECLRPPLSRRTLQTAVTQLKNSQNYTQLSLIGAYVYPTYISITINSQSMVKQPVYCRYYDCQRNELLGSHWKSTVFPESVVHCPRRIGAEFVSISREMDDRAPTPMRLKFRIFDKPVHNFTICVAAFYGQEPKWIQIAEFIEHHKMEGATFFYFHIGNISDYDRRILDEYQNSGDIEVKVLQEKYERPFYAWQLIEIQDCHMRSKYHSKWTAFIDIDERIHTTGKDKKFIDILNELDSTNSAEVKLPHLKVIKNGETPKFYEVRISNPDHNSLQIGIMSIHEAIALEPGFKSVQLDANTVVFRHYKDTLHRVSGNDWAQNETISENPIDSKYTDFLAEKVVQKVENAYKKIPANCSTIPVYMTSSRDFPDPLPSQVYTHFKAGNKPNMNKLDWSNLEKKLGKPRRVYTHFEALNKTNSEKLRMTKFE